MPYNSYTPENPVEEAQTAGYADLVSSSTDVDNYNNKNDNNNNDDNSDDNNDDDNDDSNDDNNDDSNDDDDDDDNDDSNDDDDDDDNDDDNDDDDEYKEYGGYGRKIYHNNGTLNATDRSGVHID